MDKIPGSTGVPPGGGADGAFERFLTAAIATIITIMFSWRLLSEEEQAAMAQGNSSLSRASIGFQSSCDRNDLNSPHKQIPEQPKSTQVNTSDIDIKDNNDIIEKETTMSIHSQPVNSLDLHATPPFPADDSLISETSADETLTTWDDYKWEEEDDNTEVFHTRRSVKDFINSSKTKNTTPENDNDSRLTPTDDEIIPQGSSPSASFTQRFANFEYRDTGGDSGYIDLYPDVESDDSTDDSEHEYDIQVSDSDSSDDDRGAAFFGVTSLDTIMEEEPYDFESDDSCDKKAKASRPKHVDNKTYEKSQTQYERTKTDEHLLCTTNTGIIQAEQSSIPQPSGSSENIQSYLSLDMVSKASDVNISDTKGHLGVSSHEKECDLTVNNTTSRSEQMSGKLAKHLELQRRDTNSSDTAFIQPEINCETETTADQSPFVLHLSKLQSKMKQYTQGSGLAEEPKTSDVSDDSLPPSPVRTCALDNLGDEAFSDTESCSSESVITVLSVRSADSDQYRNIDLDDIYDEPLNTSVISIIKNGQTPSSNPPSNQTANIDSNYDQMKYCENSANTRENIDHQFILPSYRNSNTVGPNLLYENGVSSSQINGTVNTDSSETGNSVGSSSTDSLISQENNQINTESTNLAVNGFDTSRSAERSYNNGQVGHLVSGNEYLNKVKSSSSSSDSSDPPLREYDPEDDDLAELHFHPDSDDDSFYLIVGDEKNLRNFETYQNLNSVGLSPEYGDARTSSTINESVTGFTFSRTEEVSTQFRKRTFVTDRSCNTSDSETRSDEPLSPITSEDEDNRSSENEQDSTEKVIVEFDLTKALNSDPTDSERTLAQQSNVYDDAVVSNSLGVDKSLKGQTENDRKLDFNKYIIQTDKSTDTCNELKNSKDIDSGSIDSCPSIVAENAFNSGHIKTCIDPNSLETRSSGVKQINNSVYEGETFSELLDKIEHLRLEKEFSDTVSNEQEQICGPSGIKEPADKKTVRESTSESDKLETGKGRILQKTQNDTVVEIATDIKQSENLTKNGGISKKETNVDDLWSADTNLKVLAQSSKCRETNVDDILYDKATERTQYESSKIKSNETSESVINDKKVKIETNVDDLFCESISNELSDFSDRSSRKETTSEIPKIETSADDIINETILDIQLSSQLQSSPREKINRTDKPAKRLLSKEIQSNDKSGINYEIFSNDLVRRSSPSSSQIENLELLEQSRSNKLYLDAQLKPVNTENKQISINAISSEYSDPVTKIAKSSNLSIGDKEITGDLYRDKAHITESNDFKQCRGEASVTNDIGNSYIGQSYQTIPQQLRQNPIDCSIVSKHNVQNNRTSNNVGIDVRKNCSVTNKESETNSSQGIVQLTQDKSSAKRHSDALFDYCEATQLNLGSVPTNLDYNSNIHVPKTEDNKINFGVKPSKLISPGVILDLKSDTEQTQENFSENSNVISCDDIELKITECAENGHSKGQHAEVCTDSPIESSSLISDTESLNSLEDSFNNLKHAYGSTRQRGHSESALGRVVRTPVVVPSDYKKPRILQGVKKKIHTTNLKKYTSILQQPITPERVHVSVSTPEKQVPLSRLKISQCRKKFLSDENLSGAFDDKFLHYRDVLVTSTPRKYLKRHERHLVDMQSTESLPADMSVINSSYTNFSSMDRIPNHLDYTTRHIEELYPPGYDSRNSSYERPDFDKLHKDCMFSPKKREEIRHTTESLENMFEKLLRYSSVSSLIETNLDNDETKEHNLLYDTDIRDYVSFQYPLERAASMSALTGSSDGHRLPRKPGKGRFASRQVPKSKSLQTLETNIDDVFENESEIGGELRKTPSVHELRVSKSLSKLNVPDWFKKSTFSRSDSTHSLFTYAGRQGSTSTIGSSIYPPSITTSPSPSVTPGSNAVIIQKRVTPTNTSSTAKLIRAPLLPTTPEKSPIHPTAPFSLPSDKFRKADKKDLKPIAIVPFAKLREMFERGSGRSGKDKKSPVKSPVKETPPKVTFAPLSPSKETVIDESISEPVQNHTSASPPPPIPERKPILTDRDRTSESVQHNHNSVENTHQRRAQVHFSDDEEQVSKSQEQNLNSVRKSSKPQSIRTSLPMPQFRFRRPTNVKPVSQQHVQSTQSKKETTV